MLDIKYTRQLLGEFLTSWPVLGLLAVSIYLSIRKEQRGL